MMAVVMDLAPELAGGSFSVEAVEGSTDDADDDGEWIRETIEKSITS